MRPQPARARTREVGLGRLHGDAQAEEAPERLHGEEARLHVLALQLPLQGGHEHHQHGGHDQRHLQHHRLQRLAPQEGLDVLRARAQVEAGGASAGEQPASGRLLLVLLLLLVVALVVAVAVSPAPAALALTRAGPSGRGGGRLRAPLLLTRVNEGEVLKQRLRHGHGQLGGAAAQHRNTRPRGVRALLLRRQSGAGQGRGRAAGVALCRAVQSAPAYQRSAQPARHPHLLEQAQQERLHDVRGDEGQLLQHGQDDADGALLQRLGRARPAAGS